jgi:hypothetical protein
MELLGYYYGIRWFKYGACEVFAINNPDLPTAFLQGDEAAALWDEADDLPGPTVVFKQTLDLLLGAYL